MGLTIYAAIRSLVSWFALTSKAFNLKTLEGLDY